MADVTTQELEMDNAGKQDKPPTAIPADKDTVPSIAWLLIEPRHYQEAQRIKKDVGIDAYRDYVISLVFSLDGRRMPPQQPLTKKVIGQVAAAFEERYGVAKG